VLKDSEKLMTKQIEIHGRRVRLYSLDDGRTWSSSPQSIVAYGQRKTMLRLELQKSFERIDAMPDPVKAAVMHPVRRWSIHERKENNMFYIIGVIVVVLFIAGYFGLR